jgi:hypothetical protein
MTGGGATVPGKLQLDDQVPSSAVVSFEQVSEKLVACIVWEPLEQAQLPPEQVMLYGTPMHEPEQPQLVGSDVAPVEPVPPLLGTPASTVSVVALETA